MEIILKCKEQSKEEVICLLQTIYCPIRVQTKTMFHFHLEKNKILSQWKTNFSYFSQEIGILRSSHVGNVNDLVYAIEVR